MYASLAKMIDREFGVEQQQPATAAKLVSDKDWKEKVIKIAHGSGVELAKLFVLLTDASKADALFHMYNALAGENDAFVTFLKGLCNSA